jgi:hypothetical protein
VGSRDTPTGVGRTIRDDHEALDFGLTPTGVGRTVDRRIVPTEDLAALPVRDHARRLIGECFRLGALDDMADLRLAQRAHMLGFRGHFSTKSRRYSTTLGALRAARAEHARGEQITTGRLPLFDEDTVLVIAHWEYAGKGYSAGDAVLAAAIMGARLPGAGGGAE